MLPYQLHQKLRQAQRQQIETSSSSLSILKGKVFWHWDKHQHTEEYIRTNGQCCANHILGLPIKNNKAYPIFEFQKQIFDYLEEYQNIWIKKARGIGVTTFLIRYLVWKVLYSNELDGKSIFIISGTREEFANYVKKKMEDLFAPRFPNAVFDSKYTELWINKTFFKVMPTKNIKDVRGYMDVAYLFIDEADHFDKSIQEELEPAITAYEEKSKGKTIMVSTPNAPGGLFERIEKDPNSKYKKLFLGYELGLGKIYDPEYIALKKLEPEFEREYNLKYLGKVGNMFSSLVIDKLGELYKDLEISQYTIKSCGVDFGFGSSKTAIVMTEYLPEQEKIRVVFCEEYDHANPNDIVNICFDFYRKYQNIWFFVDGANRDSVIQMKVAFSEESDYEKFTQSPNQVRVIPTNFQKEHRTMLSHLYSLVNKEYLCIPAKYDKLAISLRTKNVTMNYLLEDQGKFVEQTKEMQTKTVKGEEVNVYVRGAARDTYSMEWDKKKAQDMLTNKKYFGEDTVNITNPSETVYIVKFPHSNPSRTGFDKEDFMNLTYQALWDKARTTPSPQLEALKRRQNPYS